MRDQHPTEAAMTADLVGEWHREGMRSRFHADGRVERLEPPDDEACTWRISQTLPYQWIQEKFPSPTGYYLIIDPVPTRSDVLYAPWIYGIVALSRDVLVLQCTSVELLTREPTYPEPWTFHRSPAKPPR